METRKKKKTAETNGRVELPKKQPLALEGGLAETRDKFKPQFYFVDLGKGAFTIKFVDWQESGNTIRIPIHVSGYKTHIF